MKKIRKIKIESYKSFSGKLIPISFNKKFPFPIKRIFFLHGLKNKIRGDHAHKKCSQLFMAVSGKMILNIKTPISKFQYCQLHILYAFTRKDEKEEDRITEEDIPVFISKKIKSA